jgi:CRP-like cAMP-binding protein
MKQNAFAADRRLMKALVERSKPVSCDAGRILFTQGEAPEGLYILQRGNAGLVRQFQSGKIAYSLDASAGSILGLPAVISNEPYSLSAMVRKDSLVRFVSRNDYFELMQADPSLYPSVLLVLAAELRASRIACAEIQSFSAATPESHLSAVPPHSQIGSLN